MATLSLRWLEPDWLNHSAVRRGLRGLRRTFVAIRGGAIAIAAGIEDLASDQAPLALPSRVSHAPRVREGALAAVVERAVPGYHRLSEHNLLFRLPRLDASRLRLLDTYEAERDIFPVLRREIARALADNPADSGVPARAYSSALLVTRS